MRLFGNVTARNVMLAGCTILARLLFVQSRILAPMADPKDPTLVIPGQYIIVLGNAGQPGQQASAETVTANHELWLTALLKESTNLEVGDSEVEHYFDIEGLFGYTGKFNDRVLNEIRKRPEVEYVEPDQIMYALDMIEGQTRKQHLKSLLNSNAKERESKTLTKGREIRKGRRRFRGIKNIVKQIDAPWGISRVSHGEMPGQLNKYHYPKTAGRGVDVYVIDTGINVEHADFEGRAYWGKTIPFGDIDIDGNGHGTHCAGTIASRTYGIAKKAHVIAVKVLRTNGFGTNADVIKGVEWTINAARKGAVKGRRSVANMSLGGGRSITLENAVNRAVKSGVHFAVAAGNDNEDACDYSPAGADGPITVGASTNRDSMAFFSNHGPCVDIFAPGLDITSTWIGSRRAINTISGTSMASPHVAGVLALHLSENKDIDPATLKEVIISQANLGLLKELSEETENRLLSTRRLLEAME